MGKRGPVPKKESQRRRKNKSEKPVEHADGAAEVEVPKINSKWHATAKRWFESLAKSGQSQWYQPSDWETAYLLAENISRELKPQVVGITEDGDVVTAIKPMTGAALSALLKGMSVLLVTEGDRRRAGVELRRPADGDEKSGSVTDASEFSERRRRRLQSG